MNSPTTRAISPHSEAVLEEDDAMSVGSCGVSTITENSKSAEEIRATFAKLKWSVLLSTYADPTLERDFVAFALVEQREMRLWCRVFLTFIPVLILAATAIEQATEGTPPPAPASIASLLLSFAFGTLDVGLLHATAYLEKGVERPGLHFALDYLVSVLLLLGCYFSTPGTSVTTNDPSWLSLIIFFVPMIANRGGVIGSLWVFLGMLFVLWPFVWLATWRVNEMTLGKIVDTQYLGVSACFLAVFERQARSHFLDSRLQALAHREQLRRVTEQHALLKSIVPEYISGALLTWMAGEMTTPLVRNYSSCAVAFMHLQPPAGQSGQMTRGLLDMRASPDAAAALKDSEVTDFDDETVTKRHAEENNPLLAQPGSREDDADGVVEQREAGPVDLDPSATTAAEMSHQSSEHCLGAMTQVDHILSQHSTVSKIKTIGDVVMMAGPFASEAESSHTAFQSIREVSTDPKGLQQAVEDLVDVSQSLALVAGGVHAGIHCGPLVGAIQGTSRLCFDTSFGDTVNVASRTMTGSAKLDRDSSSFCALSSDAHTVLQTLSSNELVVEERFSQVFVEAKGKKDLEVYLLPM